MLPELIRFIRIKIYDNTFKKSLRRKSVENYLYYYQNLQCQVFYYFAVVELAPLRGGNEFGTRP